MLDSLVSKVTEKMGKPNIVAVDARYKTPYIAKFLMNQKIGPVMPYTRPRTTAGYLKKNEYLYDAYFDFYICPNGQILSYRKTTRGGYKQYASDSEVCKYCSILDNCTQSQTTSNKFIGTFGRIT